MSLVNLTINGQQVQGEKSQTILDMAKSLNIKIPTLCHFDLCDIKMVNQCASCRVCMVETTRGLVPACATYISEGMEVKTDSLKAIKARRTVVELLLSNHPQDCLVCDKNGACELQDISADLGIRQIRYQGERTNFELDKSSKSIVKDMNKCILCRRCETMCNDVQTVGALSGINRGFNTAIGTFYNLPMHDTYCTFCGQCIAVCPTGALTEISNIAKVWDLLDNKDKTVVVQVAPAVRVAIGEEFGMEPGSIATGKLVTALRKLGFKMVFDTNFAADLTIMEEASEFIHRFKENDSLPMLTSCCPAWVKFFEHQFPDLLDIPSTCKSPQEMFGAVAKGYLAPKMGLEAKDITVVSIMPCVAKKYEAARPELSNEGVSDVDVVLTTRELAKMLKEAGINLANLEEDDFDNPLGQSTGAGNIFGATGGVLEAALRTAYEWITGETLEKVDFEDLRGIDGIKEATVNIAGTDVNVAVASSLGNARKLLDDVQSGKSNYHIIEIMACPGGCIAGGGQPYHHGNYDIVKDRAAALYKIDASKEIRKSHENPDIKKIYEEFLGEPYGEKSHELLHTHYFKRDKVKI
jgi:NADH-quinone oxidoreductase subunit G